MKKYFAAFAVLTLFFSTHVSAQDQAAADPSETKTTVVQPSDTIKYPKAEDVINVKTPQVQKKPVPKPLPTVQAMLKPGWYVVYGYWATLEEAQNKSQDFLSLTEESKLQVQQVGKLGWRLLVGPYMQADLALTLKKLPVPAGLFKP